MSLPRLLARRTLVSILAIYIVLTAAFFLVAFSEAPPQTMFGSAQGEEVVPGGPRDDSVALHERLGSWLVDATTLDWGTSGTRQTTDLVADRLRVTGAYVLPAILLASAMGVLAGFVAAGTENGPLDQTARLGAYVGFGIPSIVLAAGAVQYLLVNHQVVFPLFYTREKPLFSPYNVKRLAFPAVVLAINTFVVEFRYTRSESLRYRQREFVKLLRAKGGSARTVARHVFRLSVAPLLGLLFSELLGLFVVSLIAVELVFNVPGFGEFILEAALVREPSKVMALTIVTVGVGVGGRLVSDVAYYLADPRVER